MMLIKILRSAEWEQFQREGSFAGSPDDIRDGFIHLSTQDQVEGTLARHFRGEDGLWLLELAVENDAALHHEASRRGGALFPHLYRPLLAKDVLSARPVTPSQP